MSALKIACPHCGNADLKTLDDWGDNALYRCDHCERSFGRCHLQALHRHAICGCTLGMLQRMLTARADTLDRLFKAATETAMAEAARHELHHVQDALQQVEGMIAGGLEPYEKSDGRQKT